LPDLVGIFGTGRNGSTLLARLLDGAAGVYVHPVECNFLSAIDDLSWLPLVRRVTIQNAVKGPLRNLNRAVPTSRLLRFFSSHWAELERDYLTLFDPPLDLGPDPRAGVSKFGQQTALQFIPRFLAATGEWVNGGSTSELLMLKSIETPFVFDYERLFPTMRFIHIVRSPVDVWASQKRSLSNNKKFPPWYLGGENLVTTLECRWIPHAEALVARRNDPRHFVLKYEDLVRDPRGIVGRVCEWLKLSPPAEPELQTFFGGQHPKQIPLNPSQRGVATPRQAVADLHTRHAFDVVVTARERDLIALRCGELVKQLGYELPTPSRTKTREAWRHIDEWDFKNTVGPVSWLRSAWAFVRRQLYVRKYTR